ncbi:MAG: hypothetical protein DSM106950_43180 [Stigonema ocellatum SAG 48.90 = DSM 106950]|nr:hypothetical protein [Stigonema ocellatum SAG 48.90 = DSM 106950]
MRCLRNYEPTRQICLDSLVLWQVNCDGFVVRTLVLKNKMTQDYYEQIITTQAFVGLPDY